MAVSFTVVLPTYNRREWLLRALRTAQSQTRPPEQIVVAADGCTDGTVQAVRAIGDERIEVLDLPKAASLGWENRNPALERATGDVVAYLADDDLWLPDHLQRVGELFDVEALDLVQTGFYRVWEDGRAEVTALDWAEPSARRKLLGGDNRSPVSSVSHVRDLVARHGGWRVPSSGPGDVDMWGRVVGSGARTAITREVTVVNLPARHRLTRFYDHAGAAREERQAAFLARIMDPQELVRLRLEIARAGYRAQSLGEEENRRLRADRDRAEEYADSLREENARLRGDRDRAEEYARSLEQHLRAREEEIAGLRSRVGDLEGRG